MPTKSSFLLGTAFFIAGTATLLYFPQKPEGNTVRYLELQNTLRTPIENTHLFKSSSQVERAAIIKDRYKMKKEKNSLWRDPETQRAIANYKSQCLLNVLGLTVAAGSFVFTFGGITLNLFADGIEKIVDSIEKYRSKS